MTILDKIIAYKKKEVAAQKSAFPISLLEKSGFFERGIHSMTQVLSDSETGIIAEHKRRSPSKRVINDSSLLLDIVGGYEAAGVSAISVLTDTPFFGGSLADLSLARSCTSLPILRKEFIVDLYQIYEAKAYGADAILLIAAALSVNEIREFSMVAKNLKLEVLLEVHNEEELQRSLLPTIDMLGINNRNLKTFEVSLETSKDLAPLIPNEYIKVSESGIDTVAAISELKGCGYQGFLMGEHFMKTENPGNAASQFIQQLG